MIFFQTSCDQDHATYQGQNDRREELKLKFEPVYTLMIKVLFNKPDPLLLLRVYFTFTRQTCVVRCHGYFYTTYYLIFGWLRLPTTGEAPQHPAARALSSNGSSGGSRISQTELGHQPKEAGRQPIIWGNFPEHFMNLEKIGPR